MTMQERLTRLEREVFGIDSTDTAYPNNVSIRRDIETKYQLIKFLINYAGIKTNWVSATKSSPISPQHGGQYEFITPSKKRWWQF